MIVQYHSSISSKRYYLDVSIHNSRLAIERETTLVKKQLESLEGDVFQQRAINIALELESDEGRKKVKMELYFLLLFFLHFFLPCDLSAILLLLFPFLSSFLLACLPVRLH